MGVTFKSCTACSKTFPDCGEYEVCDGCESLYCSGDCARLEEPELDPDSIEPEAFQALSEEEQRLYFPSCIDCRFELESDENLLSFLLQDLGMTRDDLLEKFRKPND